LLGGEVGRGYDVAGFAEADCGEAANSLDFALDTDAGVEKG